MLDSDLEGTRERHGVAMGLRAPVDHIATPPPHRVEMNVPCLATGCRLRSVL